MKQSAFHRIFIGHRHAFHSIQPEVFGKLSDRCIRTPHGIQKSFDCRSFGKHFNQLCIDLIQLDFCLIMAVYKCLPFSAVLVLILHTAHIFTNQILKHFCYNKNLSFKLCLLCGQLICAEQRILYQIKGTEKLLTLCKDLIKCGHEFLDDLRLTDMGRAAYLSAVIFAVAAPDHPPILVSAVPYF